MRDMERVTWKLTMPFVKLIANGNFLYDLGTSNRDSVTICSGVGRDMGGRFGKEGTWVHLSADV